MLAVGAEENAGEDDFFMAGFGESGRFGYDIVEGFAPEVGAKLGNNAIGAMGITAILDLENGALVGSLTGGGRE